LTAFSVAIVKSTKTIKLASTEDEVEVLIHEELLCFFSPYYAAALNGSFSEAQKDRFEVDLSGYDLEIFAKWLYTGDVSGDITLVGNVRLYIFADQVDIMALRRTVVNEFPEGLILYYDTIKLIHTKLPGASPLLKYALACYIAHWEPDDDDDDNDPCILDNETDPDHLLASFVYQVLRGVASRESKNPPGCPCCNDVCQYHEHSSKEEWEASMLAHSA